MRPEGEPPEVHGTGYMRPEDEAPEVHGTGYVRPEGRPPRSTGRVMRPEDRAGRGRQHQEDGSRFLSAVKR